MHAFLLVHAYYCMEIKTVHEVLYLQPTFIIIRLAEKSRVISFSFGANTS